MQAPASCICSCCEAQQSDNPVIVFLVYLAAFTPLGFLYAFDFISSKWRSIWATRRIGLVQVVLSVPCLGFLLYYIVINIIDGDYKEAAAAIAVSCVNLYNLLRTIWGLVQLYEFRNWNVEALRTIARLGYGAPKYKRCVRDDEGPWLLRLIKNTYRTAIHKRELARPKTAALGLEDVVVTVDNHMVVNNTLVDNEFGSNPFHITPAFMTLPIGAQSPRHNACSRFLTRHLRSRKSEECAVRWIASFLARFGYEWLSDTKSLGTSSSSTITGVLKDRKLNTALNLAVISTCHITQDAVSVLSPSHRFCTSPADSRTSIIENEDLRALPFGTRISPPRGEALDFSNYTATIRDAVLDDWHKTSLNELSLDDMRSVQTMSANQISCFSKLMMENYEREENVPCQREEEGTLGRFHSLKNVSFTRLFNCCFSSGSEVSMSMVSEDSVDTSASGFPVEKSSWSTDDPRINTWMYQLGCDDFSSTEAFLAQLPIRPNMTTRPTWKNTSLLPQVCIHTDNVLAFESGLRVEMYLSINSVSQSQSDFDSQYNFELNRLRASNLRYTDTFINSRETARFLGCIVEHVRTRLALWVEANAQKACQRAKWKVMRSRIEAPVEVPFSHQLLQEIVKLDGIYGEEAPTESWMRSLYVRLIYEIQDNLIYSQQEDSIDPRESRRLIMLLILGFPSLKFRIEDSLIGDRTRGDEKALSREDSTKQDSEGITGKQSSSVTEDGAPVNSSNVTLSKCFIFQAIGGPQEIKVSVRVNQRKRLLSVSLMCADNVFDWERWRNAFWGRLSAQKKWRSTRLFSKDEYLCENGILHSRKIEMPIRKVTEKVGYSFSYWEGWPPHVPQISLYETEKLYSLSHGIMSAPRPFMYLHPREYDKLVRHLVHGLKAFMDPDRQYLSVEAGKRYLREGHEKAGLDVLNRYISYSGSKDALESAVNFVLQKRPVISDQEKDLTSHIHLWAKCLFNQELFGDAANHLHSAGLKDIAKYLGMIYERTGTVDALQQKVGVLFRAALYGDQSAIDECITAAESLVFSEPNHQYCQQTNISLALAYQKRFQQNGLDSDQDLSARYVLSFGMQSINGHSTRTRQVGYLLEKGSLLKSESENWRSFFWSLKFREEKVFQSLFVQEEGEVKCSIGIGPRLKEAQCLYTAAAAVHRKSEGFFRNRLGILSHLGGPGVSPDISSALEQYQAAIKEGNTAATCNYGLISTERLCSGATMDDLLDRIPSVTSGTEMNNIAVSFDVLNESSKAEACYKRAIGLDFVDRRTCIAAKYNLLILMCAQNRSAAPIWLEGIRSEISNKLRPTSVLARQVRKLETRDDWTSAFRWNKVLEVEEFDQYLAAIKIIELVHE